MYTSILISCKTRISNLYIFQKNYRDRVSIEKLTGNLAKKLSDEMYKFIVENKNENMSEILPSCINALMLCLEFQIKIVSALHENSHEAYAELAKECFIRLLQDSGEQIDIDEIMNM